MTKGFRRMLMAGFAAAIPAAGMFIAAPATAGASTSAAAGNPPGARAAALAREAIRHLSIGQHATDQGTGRAVPGVSGQTNVSSNNWSGYADTGRPVSRVSARWREPAASCGTDVISMAAFWVGIDGFSSSSVEQDGTLIECYLGTEYQYTWWEMYPSNSVQTVGSAVRSGDVITASVTRSGSRYALRVADATHPANSFATAQAGPGDANSSAEWIAEAPSGPVTEYPLTHFATWKVSGAGVTEGTRSGTISSFRDYKITMTDVLGTTEAAPGPLRNGGRNFSVSWRSSL